MKILFCDFDGVLNSKQHFLATKNIDANTMFDANLWAMKRDTNANNMWVLGYILDKIPDLKIVVSSAWRLHYTIEEFQELFKIYKLDETRIIDKTPKMFSSQRCQEIWSWLDDHNKSEIIWAALDDHHIFHLEDKDYNNQFLTDGWVGLTMLDAFKIIKHFDLNYKEPIIMI